MSASRDTPACQTPDSLDAYNVFKQSLQSHLNRFPRQLHGLMGCNSSKSSTAVLDPLAQADPAGAAKAEELPPPVPTQ